MATTMFGGPPGNLLVRVLILVAWGLSAAPAQAQVGSCSTPGQNLFMREVMTDLYLWRDQVPDVDPLAFDSPAAYLDAVRLRPHPWEFALYFDI